MANGEPESVTLDDMEAQSASDAAAATRLDLTKVMLDGDGVPEEFRGKSAAELASMAKGLSDSLRMSESARKQAETNASLALQRPPVPVAEPVREPEMNDEQLAEIYQNDPLKAIKIMQERSIREAEKNLEARLGPLFSGSAASAEAQARAKYAAEFELFGDQISQIVGSLPNAKTAMANPQSWDDLVSFVRGKPGNFDRLVEHKVGKSAADRKAAAQAAQAADAGLSMASSVRAPSSAAAVTGQLDDLQREIAGKLNMTEAEYIKWSNVS
jgi:hypothetical protein